MIEISRGNGTKILEADLALMRVGNSIHADIALHGKGGRITVSWVDIIYSEPLSRLRKRERGWNLEYYPNACEEPPVVTVNGSAIDDTPIVLAFAPSAYVEVMRTRTDDLLLFYSHRLIGVFAAKGASILHPTSAGSRSRITNRSSGGLRTFQIGTFWQSSLTDRGRR